MQTQQIMNIKLRNKVKALKLSRSSKYNKIDSNKVVVTHNAKTRSAQNIICNR